MASFYNNKISTTYVSIIKSLDNAALTASLKELSDGSGNATGLFMNTSGDFKVTNILEWGTLKDTGENISITKFVDEADGIANNDNDTTIPTTAAIVDYVAARITLEDLDFRGDDSTVLGSVDLDSQTFAIVGTSNEIETSTSAGSQQLQIGLPNNVTISGNLQVNGLLKGNNNLVVKDTSDRTMAAFYGGNKVELYFNDSKKFETTSDGVTVTGGLTATGSSVFTSASFSGTITGNVTGDLTGNVTATSVLANGVEATTRGVGDNSNAVATTAFVQSVVTAQDLDFSGDGGTGSIDLDSQTFAIIGTTNEIETSASGQTLTIGLPSSIAVNVVGDLTGNVSGNVTGNLTGDVTGDLTGIVTSSSVLANGVTGTTQPQSDNSTRIATTAYVDTQAGLSDTLSEVLAIGNTTGATKISVDNTTGGIDFIDDAKARFGTGNDLEIYHDGSNSFIRDLGTGNLLIDSNGAELKLRVNTTENALIANSNGSVELYYNNSKKFETTAGGGLLTGSLSITSTLGVDSTSSFTGLISANGGIDLGDSDQIRLGASQDFLIFHDGANSHVKDNGTGSLFLQGSNIYIQSSVNKTAILCQDSASVDLYYDASKKFETTSGGITVTGNMVASGDVYAEDNIYITDTGTARAAISLDSSDRDNLNIKAISLGSLMRFYTQDTLALTLDASQDATFSGSVTIAQDLTVNGTTTTINTSTIAVEDSMIEMAKDNAANSLDIGTYGKYNDGSARYLGLFSDASDSNKFKLFKGLTVQPTTTVDTSDGSFALADLDINALSSGNITSSGELIVGSGEYISWGSSGSAAIEGSTVSNRLRFYTNSTLVLTLDSSQNAEFAGDLTANVGTFNSDSGGTGLKIIGRSTANAGTLRYYQNNGTTQTARIESNDSIFEINSISNLPIELKTNNTTALTLDTSQNSTFAGNVGINTASTAAILTVTGAVSDDWAGRFENTSTDGFGILAKINSTSSGDYIFQARTGTTNVMTILSAGVGIGTTLPSTKLEISGSGAEELLRLSAQSGFMSFYDGSTRTGYIQSDNSNGFFNIGVEDSNAFRIYMGATERMRISSGGDTTFEGNVTVGDSGNINIPTSGAGNANLNFDGTDFKITSNSSSANLKLETSSTTRLTIDSSGNSTFAGSVNAKLSNIAGLQNMFNIENATNTSVLASFGLNLSNDQLILGSDYAASFLLKTGGITALTIDTSQNATFAGNLGIGVTPEAWTVFKPLQIGQASAFVGRISSNQTDVATNFYYDGAEKRITTGYAQRYTQTSDGKHQFWTAGTDSADSTITFSQKFEIANNGDATFAGDVTVHNSSAGYSVISGDGNGGIYSSNGDVQFYTNNTAYAINFYSANKGSKLMTVVDNGDILMGNTVVNPASGFSTQKGFGYDGGTGQTQIATTDNASTLVLGRNNATDGSIIDLRKESVTIGTFGSNTTGGQPLLDISANATNGNMRFLTANAERMRIDSSGDLTMKGGRIIVRESDDGNDAVKITRDADEGYVQLFSSGSQTVELRGNGASYFNGGNVGIATTNAIMPLTIKGDASRNAIAIFNSGSGTEEGILYWYSSDETTIRAGISGNENGLDFKTGSSATNRMRITSGGDVLVAKQSQGLSITGIELSQDLLRVTKSDASPVEINRKGTDGTIVAFYKDTASKGNISITSSAVAYNTSSDYRLKENVVELTGALDRISQLKPSRFNFIADAETIVDGFLAHEVQDIVPEAITGEKDAMQDEEYEITPAKYKTVVHPAEDAVYETIEHPAIEEELDDEGNVIVEGKEAYTEEILVTEAKEEWSEEVLESEAVMGTRQVPDYQGIDQSKLVPLLVGAIQELKAEIDELKNKCNCN